MELTIYCFYGILENIVQIRRLSSNHQYEWILSMNRDLLQLIEDYATKQHSDINIDLLGKSKDTLISILLDLLTIYFNDLNSSTMRELVVAVVAGYEPSPEN